MNFSYPIKCSGISCFSPDNKLFAVVKQTDIHVYNTSILTIVRKFIFNDNISAIEFSPDSSLILVSFFKHSLCEAKSINDPDWICRIDEGIAGLAHSRWSPCSRRILTVCDFNLRLTIWSLIDKSTNFINYPKFSNKGISFTNLNKYNNESTVLSDSNNNIDQTNTHYYFMAIAERKECKDFIGIYYVADYSLVSHFVVDSLDLQDICWAKDNSFIVVFDTLLECKLLVYSPTGNIISSHIAYELGLGIRGYNFSINGYYLCVGYYDQSIRLFSHITWKKITDFEHKSNITDENVHIFKEEETNINLSSEEGSNMFEYNYNLIETRPVKLNFIKPCYDKPNPNIGIGEIKWSFDSNFIATKNEAIPNVIWIWQVSNLSLYSIGIHLKPVKSFAWSPIENLLLIVTENNRVYSMTLTEASIIPILSEKINSNLYLSNIEWSSDGNSFIVSDKSNVFYGTPNYDNNNNNTENDLNEKISRKSDKSFTSNKFDNSNFGKN